MAENHDSASASASASATGACGMCRSNYLSAFVCLHARSNYVQYAWMQSQYLRAENQPGPVEQA